MILKVISFSVALAALSFAQSPTWIRNMAAIDSRDFVITPGSVSTGFQFVLDSVPDGGDLLDINYAEPALVLSLVRPDGVEITAANAASLGYSFQVSPPGELANLQGSFSADGYHLLIQLPAGQPSGTYVAKNRPHHRDFEQPGLGRLL